MPHRLVVLTRPRLLHRIFWKRRERLLDLSQCGAEALAQYMRMEVGADKRAGIVVSIGTTRILAFGRSLEFHESLPLRPHPLLDQLASFREDGDLAS